MKYLTLFALFLSIISLQGQKRLQLRDGSVIEYKKARVRNGTTLYLSSSNEEWIQIPEEEIISSCNAEGVINYWTGLPIAQTDKVLEGRISVYAGNELATTSVVDGQLQRASRRVYYAEKGGVYLELSTKTRKRRLVMDSLLSDAPQPIPLADDENTLTVKDMLSYIREYNLQLFKPAPTSAYKRTASVSIFANRNAKESLKIEVNDSLTYTIPCDYPLTIQLPIEEYSKLCIVTEKGRFCDLLSASACTMRYLEVRFNEKRSRFDIENSTRTETQKFQLGRRSQ